MPPYAALKRRLALLEVRVPLPPPQPSLEERRRLERTDALLTRLMEGALKLMGDQESAPVSEALRRWHEAGTGPYADWFEHLAEGRSRLPPIDPGVMKELLV